jgi:polyisoprenoid-binding protein YceI
MVNMVAPPAMYRISIGLVIVRLILALQAPALIAQQAAGRTYKLESGSRLNLEGTATIGEYKCETREIDGSATLAGSKEANNGSPDSGAARSRVLVAILVRSFECGKRAMNSDMYNAMKADSFPSIAYELKHAEIHPDSEAADSARTLDTSGELTIAGVTRLVEMSVTIRQVSPNRFRVFGSKDLSMHDFGITPPTALWGLIKAEDKLIVSFDLVAREEPSEQK